MTDGARRTLLVAVVLLAGALAGSGLAALAHTPPNGGCASNSAAMTDGVRWSGSRGWWPLGTSCEYRLSGRSLASERYAAGVGELLAWIVLAAMLAAFAVLDRGSAIARGAAAGAGLLALAGPVWHYGEINFAVLTAILLGPPLVFAIDLVLRPRGTRTIAHSALTAIALPAPVFCAFLVSLFLDIEAAGIVVAIITGAAVSAGVARWEPPRGDLLPSE